MSVEPVERERLGREPGAVQINGGPHDGLVAAVPGPQDGAAATLLLSLVEGAWHAYQLVQTNADRPHELSHLGRVQRLPSLLAD